MKEVVWILNYRYRYIYLLTNARNFIKFTKMLVYQQKYQVSLQANFFTVVDHRQNFVGAKFIGGSNFLFLVRQQVQTSSDGMFRSRKTFFSYLLHIPFLSISIYLLGLTVKYSHIKTQPKNRCRSDLYWMSHLSIYIYIYKHLIGCSKLAKTIIQVNYFQ